MKATYYLILLFYCLPFTTGSAQSVDSLFQQLNNSKSDSSKAYLLVQLAKSLYASELENSYRYAQEAQDFAKASKQWQPYAESFNIMGIYNDSKGNYLLSFQQLSEGLEWSRVAGDSILVSKILNNLGLIYKTTGRLEQAVDSYLKSLRIAEQFGSPEDIAVCHNNLGIIYKLLGNTEYSKENNAKAYSKFKEAKNYRGMSAALNNIGLTFRENGDYDSALYYFEKSLKVKQEINYKKGYTSALFNIGLIYSKRGLYVEAMNYYDKALTNAQEVGAKTHIAVVHAMKGDLFMILRNYKSAIDNYEEAMEINEKIGRTVSLLENLKSLSEVYNQIGQHQKAYQMQANALILKDSIFDQDMAQAISALQLDYELSSKNKQIEVLKANEENTRIKAERDNILYGFSALIMLLLILVAYQLYRRNKRKHRINKKLEYLVDQRTQQLNDNLKEFDLFVYKSAHDLRGPVAQLLGLYQLMRIDKGERAEVLDKFKLTVDQMDALLARLSHIHHLRNKDIVLESISIEQILVPIEDKVRKNFKGLELKIERSNSINNTFETDIFLLSNIFEELILNAINFKNNEGGIVIKFNMEQKDNNINISFSDNGEGIPVEFQDKVFDMFYKASEKSKGYGLGLYVQAVIVRKLGGSIQLIKSDNSGTDFEISLPMVSPSLS